MGRSRIAEQRKTTSILPENGSSINANLTGCSGITHPPSTQPGHLYGVATVVTPPGVTPSMSTIITTLKPRLAMSRHMTSIAGGSKGWFVA
ncbi:MAG TPA: hypothetical protein VGM05_14915 [Planctomycetaceae bacterium]